MSTQLRNVPNCEAQNELTQTRFWGGENRMTCVQVTQRKSKASVDATDKWFTSLQLTKHQARELAVELMLFAEGREVEESEEWHGLPQRTEAEEFDC
jgi:formylmethanofuran dehydrogenase subunit B